MNEQTIYNIQSNQIIKLLQSPEVKQLLIEIVNEGVLKSLKQTTFQLSSSQHQTLGSLVTRDF